MACNYQYILYESSAYLSFESHISYIRNGHFKVISPLVLLSLVFWYLHTCNTFIRTNLVEPFNRKDKSQKLKKVMYSVAIVAEWSQH